ncbi:pirin family protein [Acinetobacter calcoaceticus]|uniref:pirin family protein n=1 Tax=Acinetobacter calcoaceticus TaxID=471 RepID=UPI0005F07A84|nr:pirin family protein [Acinetobacter calcoaceticus]
MVNNVIYKITSIDFRLDLKDPFLFTAHHIDHFPASNENMGPISESTKDEPYQMYFGDVVPGFSEHPHTGFETITLVESGYVDHFDSLGNSGRYSAGDVQWLSTGNGIEHCEMFPLIHLDKPNPFELFQIWFNSSPEQKKQNPAYKMMWREQIPHVKLIDQYNNNIDIRIISGSFQGTEALSRPIHSWAADSKNKVNIYMLTLDAHAEIYIPSTSKTSNRFAYFYQGSTLNIQEELINYKQLVELKPDEIIHLKAGEKEARILWLEGEPIGAPVALRGPFVLNNEQELNEAFRRYRVTHFGKWPWPSIAPVFKRDQERFASYKGGQEKEYPERFNK